MRTSINRALFENVDRDSRTLSVLSTIIHRFTEPGLYSGSVEKSGREVGHFTVEVKELMVGAASKGSGEPVSPTVACEVPPTQVNVNLRELDLSDQCNGMKDGSRRYVVNKGGVVQFHVPSGTGGYSIRVTKGRDKEQKAVMDSNELGPDDLFTTLILRSGTYSITNEITKAKAKLIVTYPEEGKIPKRPTPIEMECSDHGITPANVKIVPTQPLVFRFKVRSRIAIKMVEPDDGPKKAEPLAMRTTGRKISKDTVVVGAKAQKAKPPRRRVSYPAGFLQDE